MQLLWEQQLALLPSSKGQPGDRGDGGGGATRGERPTPLSPGMQMGVGASGSPGAVPSCPVSRPVGTQEPIDCPALLGAVN